MKSMKQALALLLCFLMLFSTPVNALATGSVSDGDIVIIETENTTCEECGSSGAHTEECALYATTPASTACSECGLEDGHAEICSQYEAPASSACTECGMESGHAETCSQYEAPAAEGCSECGAKEGHAETCSQYEAPAPVGCAECGQEEGHTETCSQYEDEPPAPSVYDQLIGSPSLESFRAVLLAAENREAVLALTAEEIEILMAYIEELYAAIEDPTEDEDYFYEELIETLTYLPAMECPECGEFGGHADDCVRNLEVLPGGGKASGTMTGAQFMEARDANNVVQLTGNVSLTSHILVSPGETLILDLNGWVLNVTGASRAIFCHGGEVTIKDSTPTSSHNGRMVPVTSWLDKRLNHGRYGSLYNVASDNHFADRYILTRDYSGDNELWVYDETGNTPISGGIITGGKADYHKIGNSNYSGGGAIYMLGGKLTIEGGTIAGCAAYRFFNANGDGKIPSSIPTTWYQSYAWRNSAPNGGAVMCNGGAEFIMNGGAIMYNWADYCGGGVYTVGSNTVFTMNGGKITDNCTRGEGGGIAVRSGSVFNFGPGSSVPVISLNKTFDSNYTGGGGGISVSGAVINFNNGKVESNKANGSGGGIYCYRGGSVTASASSVISGNTAGGNGGGIYIQYGTVTLNGSTVTSNKAGSSGGAVSTRVASFIMNGGVLSNNTANAGGAVNLTAQNNIGTHYDNGDLGSSASISNAKIYGNKATNSNGGALFVDVKNSSADMTVTLDSCEIYSNSAASNGGAIYLLGGTLTVKGSTNVYDNSAKNGGAFYVADKSRSDAYYVNTDKLPSDARKNEAGWWENVVLSTKENGEYVYVTTYSDTKPGSVVIESGTFTNNTATNGSGGVLYLTGTQSEVTMSGGTLKTNSAPKYGGAIYVSGGNFNMDAGAMTQNSAELGGSVYVSDGNVNMNGGTMSYNTADDGGAVYITGGNFNMISGELLSNGSQSDISVTEYGGAVYVDGGDITVGVEKCSGAGGEGSNHTSTHTNKSHPIIKGNKAQYGGAFAVCGENDSEGNATSGRVTVYCSFIKDNKADNEGTGHNIFMDGGGLKHYLNSAEIGSDSNHDIVSIGGQLQVVMNGEVIEIKLIYDSNAMAVNMTWEGSAPVGYNLNLPYCPEEWQDKQALPENGNKAFVGWSHVKSDTTLAETVRSTENYLPIGKAVEIVNDGSNQMTFYAVWAPKINDISYAFVSDGVTVEQCEASEIGIGTGYETYNYEDTSYPRGIPDPTKSGYKFMGWKIYASKAEMSNWGLDASVNPPTKLTDLAEQDYWNGSMSRNFGDITLVAIFEPQFTDLTIIVQGSEFRKDPSQSFIFTIFGNPLDDSLDDFTMEVVITADKEQVTVTHLPVGDYTITEKTGWSWRYDVSGVEVKNAANTGSAVTGGINFTMLDPEKTANVTFTQNRANQYWLSGDDYCANWWTPTDGVQKKDD